MRRKDHERMLHDKDREIVYLRRQNDELLNRVMYMAGETWTPPPPTPEEPKAEVPDIEFDPVGSLDF